MPHPDNHGPSLTSGRDEDVFVKATLDRLKPWLNRELSYLGTAGKNKLLLDLHSWIGTNLDALGASTDL